MAEQNDYLPELLRRIEARAQHATLTALSEAAEAHPEDPRPMLLLAGALVHAGRIEEADGAYRETLRRAPDLVIARFQLGLLRFTSGRASDAAAAWAPLDALPETHPLRQFKTGLELLAQDRFAEARAWIERGLEQDVDNPPLRRDMRLVLARIAALDGEAARPSLPEEPGAGHFLVSSYRDPE